MPNHFSEDPAARREIELAAMQAVMAAERALGHEPVDVSAQKIGYDIASHNPKSGHLRFIEVKGRIDGADSVMITRQEVITSLHEPEKFILAIVSVAGASPMSRAMCAARLSSESRLSSKRRSSSTFRACWSARRRHYDCEGS